MATATGTIMATIMGTAELLATRSDFVSTWINVGVFCRILSRKEIREWELRGCKH